MVVRSVIHFCCWLTGKNFWTILCQTHLVNYKVAYTAILPLNLVNFSVLKRFDDDDDDDNDDDDDDDDDWG